MKKTLLIFIILFTFFVPTENLLVDVKKRNNDIREYFEEERVNNIIRHIEEAAEIKIPDYANIDHVLYMYEIANENEIPIRIAFRLIHQESRFREHALSPVGAYGYTQLMPGTYYLYSKKLNFEFTSDHNPYKNIFIGMYYLKHRYEFWSERCEYDEYAWTLALASYNAGIGNVIKYKGVPPFSETMHYVNYIMTPHSNETYYAKT